MSDPRTFLTRTILREVERDRGGIRKRDPTYVYASAMSDLLEVPGDGCLRKLYLDFFPEHATPTPMPADKLLNFKIGDAYHEEVEKYLRSAGTVVVAERPLKDYSPNVSGRLDALVRHPQYGLAIIDGKSMSPWAFNNKLSYDADGYPLPKIGDAAQITSYVEPCKKFCDDYGIAYTENDFRFGAVLYFNKVNGKFAEAWFEIDPAMGVEIEQRAAAFSEGVKADQAAGVFNPPAIPVAYAKGNGFPCRWGRPGTPDEGECKFRSFCHPKVEKPANERAFTLKG